MDREQVIRMARDADCGHESIDLRWISPENLERFAALIEAAATEKANERANTSWALMCEKMVKAEREACAKACEEQKRGAGDAMTFYTATGQCAAAIRNRKDTTE